MSHHFQLTAFVLILGLSGCSVGGTSVPAASPDTSGVEAAVDLSSAPPLANAGGDQAVPRGGIVMLDSRRSFDPAGKDFSLVWTQTGGKTIVTLSNPGSQPALTSFLAPAVDDVLTFQLLATDLGGLSTSDQAVIHVVPSAQVTLTPSVNTEGDSVVQPFATFVLSAQAPFGVLDGPIVWTQVAGPATVPLSGVPVNSYSATAPGSGLLILSATGTAAGLRSAPDYSIVAVSTTQANSCTDCSASGPAGTEGPVGPSTVGANSPTAAVSNSVAVKVVAPAAPVELSDPSETSESSWQQVYGPPVGGLTQSADGLSFDFTAPLTVGILGFTLSNQALAVGLRAAPIVQEVQVVDPALVGASVAVGSDQLAHVGSSVVLDGSLSAPITLTLSGLNYVWASASTGAPPVIGQASGPAASLSDPNFSASVTLAESGTFVYSLSLVDANTPFGQTPPSTLTISTVPSSQNLPPVIVLSKLSQNGGYLLTATLSDPENDPTSGYAWTLSDPNDGTLATPNQLSTTVQLAVPSTIATFAACDSLAACNQASIAVP